MNETETKINDWANQYNVTANFEFVPFSRSRNSHEKEPSLNWKVTLYRDGREFLRCDYMQGSGHAPSYNAKNLSPWEKNESVKRECETGKLQRYMPACHYHISGKPIPSPKLADVLYSISSDASALDSPTFEDWAHEFGYEPDSRKGEAIYKTCLEYGLKLRAAVGDKGLAELRDATQDY